MARHTNPWSLTPGFPSTAGTLWTPSSSTCTIASCSAPFGPYKEGDNLETCSVNYETGEFIVWDVDDSAEDKEGETSVKEAWKGVLQMRIVEGSVEAE